MSEDESIKVLSKRSYNCLLSEGLLTKGDIKSYVLEHDRGLDGLLQIPNLGKVSFKEVAAFADLGSQENIEQMKKVPKTVSFLNTLIENTIIDKSFYNEELRNLKRCLETQLAKINKALNNDI